MRSSSTRLSSSSAPGGTRKAITCVWQVVEFHFVPGGDAPIVADMSSNILSRPIDVSAYGVIYAGAQKNIGPAGITLVIVRNDLLERVRPNTPHLLTWKSYADSDSMTNTPPTFTWYVADLVFQWLKDRGGLETMAAVNERKSNKLYAAIDGSGFYSNPVAVDSIPVWFPKLES